MSKPRIKVKKRRELSGDMNQTVGEDHESLTDMKRMNIKPITLLFRTNQLREKARKILFRQSVGSYNEMIGETTEEEKKVIMKEFEKLCGIVYDESLRALVFRHEMSEEAERKRTPGSPPSGPVHGGGEHPYIPAMSAPTT